MKQIKLGRSGKFALVDDEDFETLNKVSWSIRKYDGYAYRSFYKNRVRTNVRMHRLIMGCVNGDGKIIDHKDRNPLNNQKSNLRFCTKSENTINAPGRKNSTSKYKGVSFCKMVKKWQVQVTVNCKLVYNDYFLSEKEAAIAYNEAAKKHHGEFAWLNTIS